MKGRMKAGTGGHVSIRAIAAIVGIVLIGMGAFSYWDRFNINPGQSSVKITPYSSVTFTYADGTSQTIDTSAGTIIPFTPATVFRTVSPPWVSMVSVAFICGVKVTATVSSIAGTPPAWNPTVSFQWKVDTSYEDPSGSGIMIVKRSSPSSGTTAGSITTTYGVGQVVFKTETVTAAEIESWTTGTGATPHYVKVAVTINSITAQDLHGNTVSGPKGDYNNQVQLTVDMGTYSLTPSSVTSYTFATMIKPTFLNLPASIFGVDSVDIAGFSIPIEYILISLGVAILILGLWKGEGVAF